MKRGRSTTTPTKEEAARLVAVKLGPCMACSILAERGEIEPHWANGPSDAHHLLSGGIRRGHMETIGLCAYHHRKVPDWGYTPGDMRATFGPSLMDGSKAFREMFGTDDELLERQNRWLEENR
jgi:hypothetical protein